MPPYKENKKDNRAVKPFMPSSPAKEVCSCLSRVYNSINANHRKPYDHIKGPKAPIVTES